MGHAIEYFTVQDEKLIMRRASEFAANNVDRQENPSGTYHGNMQILHNVPICASYEDAVNKLKAMAKGTFYQDFAVRYYDVDSVKPTKEMEKMAIKIQELRQKKQKYIESHSVKMHSSKQVGCAKCGSKVTISFLRSENCPVCSNDLRAEYILERISKYDKDINDLSNKKKEMAKKLMNKAPVKWCFKVEVHS